jgi:hypothetical protein
MITVRKLECRYFAPSDHPDPESLRARLDDAVQHDFPAALAAAFPSTLPTENESLWMIRRIDLTLDSTGEWTPDEFARTWATNAAVTIVETMFSPDSGGNVLYFPDRAAYLAQFLTDLAQGDAWSKWYYQSFDGLRLLDTADAISAALMRDRDESLKALPRIASPAFHRILSALLSQHAEIIWHHLQPRHPGPLDTSILEEVCDLWRNSRRSALPTLEHRGLWLLHAISSNQPSTGIAIPAIRAIAALEEARLLLRPNSYDQLLSALTANDHAAVVQTAGLRIAEWLAPLLDHPGQFRTIDSAIRQDIGITSATCFGAVFLLLPAIAEFPASEQIRFAIFRRCCPPALHAHITRDPLLRDLFQLDPSEDEPASDPATLHQAFLAWLDQEEERGHWLTLPDPPHPDLDYLAPSASPHDRELCLIARAILRNFAWHLPGFAKSSLAHLWQNFLDLQARMQTFDDRRVVRLTAPPLHVVLSLTGILTATFQLPWLDSRPFCLFPER